MDYCHHGFIRDLCDICRLETPNAVPIKLVDDMKDYELVHPKPKINDGLSKLRLPDLQTRPVEPPKLILSPSLAPSKYFINEKRDLLTKDDIQLGTEIIDPKKKFLTKK